MSPKEKIQSIVSVFETGSATPKYYKLVVMNDGKDKSRQITYGKHQTTEQGNLVELVAMYVAAPGAKYAAQLTPYLCKIGRIPLHNDVAFKQLLIDAAVNDIAVMQKVQDDFFDKLYWNPAEKFCDTNDFKKLLSKLVIYDSHIHSGSVPPFLRRRFAEKVPVKGGSEEKWIASYVETRHQWLQYHDNELLRRTVYRTQCFKNQIASSNWDLTQPVNANGIII